MIKRISILFLPLLLVIIGCSDNSSDPINNKNYFPMKENNYWIYDTKTYNQEDNTTVNSIDSIVIKQQTTKNGQLCYQFESNSNVAGKSNFHQYSSNQQLFTLLSDILPKEASMFISQANIPEKWLKIADDKATSWFIDSLALPEFNFDMGGIPIPVKTTLKLTGLKRDIVTIHAADKDLSAQSYTINMEIVAKFGTYPIPPVTINIPTHYYYTDGIGLIKREVQSTSFTILTNTYKTSEITSVLKRYKVN